MVDTLPSIATDFDQSDDEINQLIRQSLALKLKKILPPFLGETREDSEDCVEWLNTNLPIVQHSPLGTPPYDITFHLLSRYRPNTFKFFFELISRWLVPGKRLNCVHFQASDFRLPDFGNETYTLTDMILRVETPSEDEEIRRNLAILETEICLGARSAFHARKILEVKGLTADEKTASIHEYISFLVGRLPDRIDNNVFTEMQHVLVTASDQFKAERESRHLARLITYHYLFRQDLITQVKRRPDKRHLHLKLTKTRLHTLDGVKTVLGVIVGVNFLKDKEVFEERHLLKAIQNYVPSAKPVEDSFLANTRIREKLGTLYLEIYREDGKDFSVDEIRRLRTELPNDLKDRIEHLMHPIFMPRNEEEIMRYILSLSNQIKYVRDIPQVVISFDEQTDPALFFNIIAVRVLKPLSKSIKDLITLSSADLHYIHDRSKIVGNLRRKYPKEATVFRVKIPKDPFLRSDHSIDLYKARAFVASELVEAIGEFRDFNGGIISKQHEVLLAIRSQLSKENVNYNDFLLENFFYSINPVLMRSVLPPVVLKSLFCMLLDSLNEDFFSPRNPPCRFSVEDDYYLSMIKLDDPQEKERIQEMMDRLDTSDIAYTFVTVYNTPYLGYILHSSSSDARTQFRSAIESVFETPTR